ncbi:hypothetical protein THTE_4283 [Thermogutta terrifontis]|uniref:Uncharacterized protein n=1 Tax=Thermogutta terrifontis TaxID=1331910 RepID=A0A286RLQ1_9BACT|nr:hypothetical protein THTE_4283 [Thermogutta terrifontis]
MPLRDLPVGNFLKLAMDSHRMAGMRILLFREATSLHLAKKR